MASNWVHQDSELHGSRVWWIQSVWQSQIGFAKHSINIVKCLLSPRTRFDVEWQDRSPCPPAAVAFFGSSYTVSFGFKFEFKWQCIESPISGNLRRPSLGPRIPGSWAWLPRGAFIWLKKFCQDLIKCRLCERSTRNGLASPQLKSPISSALSIQPHT